MGRPKMTDEQKAAAKAAREAAKEGVQAAADRAEARAGTRPKAEPIAPEAKSNDDWEEKALFLNHLPIIKSLRAALNTATANLRNGYKRAKAEGGFKKIDFDVAIAMETAEKEAKEKAKIARALQIAKYMGSALGNQLDMFLEPEPDRTPLADRAFEEGESDAMQNIPARPSYDPSTEAYRRYLDGFHSVSERRIKEGMGTLHPEVEADEIEKARQKAEREALQARDAAAFEEYDAEAAGEPEAETQSSGTPMTRAQFRAQQEALKAAGTKH